MLLSYLSLASLLFILVKQLSELLFSFFPIGSLNPNPLSSPLTIAGLVFILLLWLSLWGSSRISNFLAIIFFYLLCFTLVHLYTHFQPFFQYGDQGSLEVISRQARPFTRWFLGSTAILDIYWKIWQPYLFPAFINVNFTALLSSIFINFSTILLLRKIGPKLYLIFPILSSLWLMFSLGYDEYYPFITPIFVFTLIWFLKSSSKYSFKSYFLAGIVVGLLPLIYIGFAPLALIIFLYFALSNFRAIPLLLSTSLLTSLLSIWRFWPWGIKNFFTKLIQEMSFGEQYISYGRYLEKSAGDYSINFSLSYVFTQEHFRDLGYMLLFGGGLFPLLLLLIGAGFYFKLFKFSSLRQQKLKIAAVFLFLSHQIYYFLFMMPKLGPRDDIDLFFSVFLTFAVLAGFIWEKIIPKFSLEEKWTKFLLIAVWLGYSLINLEYLILRGLPSI